MQKQIGTCVIQVVTGDITTLPVDALVNAANNSLLGGGGVDGAIHKAGGPKILEECKQLGGCETGQAKITSGGNLSASFVIHTVGPVWHGGNSNESHLLAACYTNSLKLADHHHLQSIAFPGISTGVYGYPIPQAALVATAAIEEYLLNNTTSLTKVLLVAFNEASKQAYEQLF